MGPIGIFGDSFADWRTKIAIRDIAWPMLLGKKTSRKVIDSAEGGSSLYWAYHEFLKYEKECDDIIFLATNPGRYTRQLILENYNIQKHINSEITVNSWLELPNITDNERATLENLRGFYKVMDPNWELLACTLLLNRIHQIRPDTIFVFCFFNYSEFNIEHTVPLSEIVELQLKSLNLIPDMFMLSSKYREKFIACHFTPEVNEFVCDRMIDSLKEKRWICPMPDRIIHNYPASHYYDIVE